MRIIRRRLRGDQGQGTLEYVGVAVLMGLVFAVMGGSALGLDTKMVQAVNTVICKVTNGSCAGNGPTDLEAKLPDCEVYSEDYAVKGEITVFSVNLGANGKLALREVIGADGKKTYLVDQQVGADVGAHIMFGEEGKFGLGEGLGAQVKAGLTGKGSRTFAFDNEKDARAFIEASAAEVGKQGVKASLPPGVGDIAKWGLDKITGTEYKEPKEGPKEYFFEGGTKISGSANAEAGIEAGVGAEGAELLGVKVTKGETAADGSTKPDRYTVYVKGNSKLNGELGILGVGPTGELEGESVIGISYENGQPVEMSLETAGKVKSSLLGKGDLGDIPLGKNLPKASGSLGVDVAGTEQGKVALTLDLTNSDNKRAVADVLNSVGIPVMTADGTPGYQDPATATQALVDRFKNAGPAGGASITAQKYEGSDGKFQVGFFGGDLLTFGAGGEVSTSNQSAVTSLYYDPAKGMVPWRRCGG
ncbi:hypothetical protein GCM10027446_12390 [Angustibacter peucedani]